jgi:hypothetical protein
MRVPPGISERDFAQALQQFASVVGHEWVFSSEEDVALYRDAYSPLWGEPEAYLSAAVFVARHLDLQVSITSEKS